MCDCVFVAFFLFLGLFFLLRGVKSQEVGRGRGWDFGGHWVSRRGWLVGDSEWDEGVRTFQGVRLSGKYSFNRAGIWRVGFCAAARGKDRATSLLVFPRKSRFNVCAVLVDFRGSE